MIPWTFPAFLPLLLDYVLSRSLAMILLYHGRLLVSSHRIWNWHITLRPSLRRERPSAISSYFCTSLVAPIGFLLVIAITKRGRMSSWISTPKNVFYSSLGWCPISALTVNIYLSVVWTLAWHTRQWPTSRFGHGAALETLPWYASSGFSSHL